MRRLGNLTEEYYLTSSTSYNAFITSEAHDVETWGHTSILAFCYRTINVISEPLFMPLFPSLIKIFQAHSLATALLNPKTCATCDVVPSMYHEVYPSTQ